MKRLLVVVDMQKDFVNGSLGTKEAQEIVPKVVDFVAGFNGDVVYTKDTHYENYFDTQEGKKLPVKHCMIGTEGRELIDGLPVGTQTPQIFNKITFGSIEFAHWLSAQYEMFSGYDEIHFVGVCTGICVISNAVLAKSVAEINTEIFIHKDLCACVTPESHERALKCMELLQMNIV